MTCGWSKFYKHCFLSFTDLSLASQCCCWISSCVFSVLKFNPVIQLFKERCFVGTWQHRVISRTCKLWYYKIFLKSCFNFSPGLIHFFLFLFFFFSVVVSFWLITKPIHFGQKFTIYCSNVSDRTQSWFSLRAILGNKWT